MSQICVVTSGKGGAGKSTVTAGLGYALGGANRGRNALLGGLGGAALGGVGGYMLG